MIASLLKWGGGAVVTAALAFQAQLCVRVNNLEKPVYTVSKTIHVGKNVRAELREYEPYVIAESVVTGDTMRKATSDGFMNVARYIFGDNTGRRGGAGEGAVPEKVAMTAPVRTEQSQKVPMTTPLRTEMWGSLKDMKVSFVMPKKHTKETLPQPNDKNVKIKSVPGHRIVAISFRGRSPNEAKIAGVSRDLFQALEDEGLSPKGGLMVYQYHPPFIPGFLRRNEVAVMV